MLLESQNHSEGEMRDSISSGWYLSWPFAIWCLSTVIFSGHQAMALDHPRLPLTADWVVLSGKNTDGHVVARKYALVMDTPDNLIRNVLLFYCSLKEDSPSYLDFVIPKEIKLSEIFGEENVPSRIFRIETANSEVGSKSFMIAGEVKGNELFFDFSGNYRQAVLSILIANKVTIFLEGDQKPFEFFTDPSFKAPLDDKEVSLDEFVRTMIDRSGDFSRTLEMWYFERTCIDIKAWKKSHP
ncbi:hypothetical protein [Mesorhizobium jarvisii]|uniref:hypothetical protein n=1 Tax=Mesorhizobium jarvisii TaxID=1777867 RepID=UPI001F0AF38B|nr:hypothetical protein [Mesorhizobium jarvisii]MCH4560971.1 hypothetical protein [Mesorhizobium jarvisii]